MSDEKMVTVRASDVEALILAAEYMGKVEDMLRARKDAPQYLRQSGTMRESIDSVRRAWGAAIRVNDDPLWGQPLTSEERLAMKSLWQSLTIPTYGGNILNSWHPEDIEGNIERQVVMGPAVILYLRRKGMVVMGQVNTVVKWGDKSVSSTSNDHSLVKLTERGIQWCNENLQ